ncbi:hypothetical protein Tco_1565775, partial [Tanacetum coccineum]
VDPLNPPPHASESEPDDEIEVEDAVESKDETVPARVHEMAFFSRRLCGRETAHALVEKKGKAKDKYHGKLILDLGNEVRSSVEQRTAAMEKLVKKLGNTKDKVECKRLKMELEEAKFSNTFLRFMLEERPNEAIEVSIEDEKSPSSESIMPPKSALMTEAAIRRMIKESFDAAIVAERARQANVRNDASGSGPVRGPVELRRWFEKTKSVLEISECAEGKK